MHAFILVVIVFLSAQAGTPERAVTQSLVVPTADACKATGAQAVSQISENPKVSFAGFACFEVANPNDKVA